jgi:hypothetical protein
MQPFVANTYTSLLSQKASWNHSGVQLAYLEGSIRRPKREENKLNKMLDTISLLKHNVQYE